MWSAEQSTGLHTEQLTWQLIRQSDHSEVHDIIAGEEKDGKVQAPKREASRPKGERWRGGQHKMLKTRKTGM